MTGPAAITVNPPRSAVVWRLLAEPKRTRNQARVKLCRTGASPGFVG